MFTVLCLVQIKEKLFATSDDGAICFVPSQASHDRGTLCYGFAIQWRNHGLSDGDRQLRQRFEAWNITKPRTGLQQIRMRPCLRLHGPHRRGFSGIRHEAGDNPQGQGGNLSRILWPGSAREEWKRIDGRAILSAVGSEYPVALWEAWEWEKEYTCMHVCVSICAHLTCR